MLALNINNLCKTYKNDVKALKGIQLQVEAGDFFALLGPNGAGKSTTIGIISSLVNKTSGEVSIFGHSIDTQLSAAKKHIGLVPQEFNFNQFETVRQIVVNQAGFYGITRKIALSRSQEVLERLSLWDKRNIRSRELSGGMKRRLLIARAMMHKPRLLILDEPTAGVDIEIRRNMWGFLQELNEKGTTIVLTTHYLEEAESLCRNIAIINHGEIIENTSMKTLLASLDRETFVLDVAGSVTELPQLDDYQMKMIDEKTIEVDVAKSQELNQLFVQLAEHDIRILSMRNKANRLEELFVRMLETKQEKAVDSR